MSGEFTEQKADSNLRYEAPMLIEIGSFESITRATHHGLHLDASYVAGTPLSDPILS
jgi:hypothetical protein